MEFTTLIISTFKGCWVVFFFFIQIFIEQSVSIQRGAHSVISDLDQHCLSISHKKKGCQAYVCQWRTKVSLKRGTAQTDMIMKIKPTLAWGVPCSMTLDLACQSLEYLWMTCAVVDPALLESLA